MAIRWLLGSPQVPAQGSTEGTVSAFPLGFADGRLVISPARKQVDNTKAAEEVA
jgi:hypothetical protein